MSGGLGNDVYIVENRADQVVELAEEGTDTILSSVNWALSDGIENLTLIGQASNGTGNELDNVLIGNAYDNCLSGGPGRDQIFGGEGKDILLGGTGDDILNGGSGDDLMEGGTGDDTYIVDDEGDVVTESPGLEGGVDTVVSTVSYAIGPGVENLTLLGSGVLIGIGNALNNTIVGINTGSLLSGCAGDDQLFGGLGDDILNGGDGDDVLSGGAASNVIDGGLGRDMASYAGAPSQVTVDLSVLSVQVTGSASDLLQGIEDLEGSVYNDTLRGDSGPNRIFGGYGMDVLHGGYGDDTLYGNQGDDILYGNQGNDFLYGGQGSDILYGGQNSDTIVGGMGDDTLFGNLGDDTLYGGPGRDTFCYSQIADSPAGGSFDLLADFTVGEDLIDLRAVRRGAADRIEFVHDAIGTRVEVDLEGDGGVDMIILVASVHVGYSDVTWS